MMLSTRDRRALLLGGGALLVIILARYAVLPWIDDWQLARASVQNSQAQLDDLQRQVRRATSQSRRLEATFGPSVCRELADVQAARVALLQASQDALKKAGLQATDWQNLPNRPLKDIPGVESVPVEVRGKCQMQQLTKALAELQKQEQLIVVHRIRVTNNEKQPGQLEISLELATLARSEATR